MTSQGAGDPIGARTRIDADLGCLLHGQVRIDPCTEGGDGLSRVDFGDYAALKYVD